MTTILFQFILLAVVGRPGRLVAHDRGTFSGMLMVAGLTMMLAALWGFRRGARWLWWTLLTAGTVGYLVAIAVHYAVGYVDGWHLAPADGGLALLWLSAAASREFLGAAVGPRTDAAVSAAE